jgi:hypothetical protein
VSLSESKPIEEQWAESGIYYWSLKNTSLHPLIWFIAYLMFSSV